MENDETVSLWNTKADDLTVGDSLKVALIATVVTTVAAITIAAGAGAAVSLAQKWQERKQAKLTVVDQEG